jgi:hypothetical protein
MSAPAGPRSKVQKLRGFREQVNGTIAELESKIDDFILEYTYGDLDDISVDAEYAQVFTDADRLLQEMRQPE